MIRHFFLDKTNSIIKKSEQNIGLNPILQVGYGKTIIRGLIHFDENKIKELINDKTFANTEKLKFTLKMTNCFSVEGAPHNKKIISGIDAVANRASSFDLMLYKLPNHFDAGRGFDYLSDFWTHGSKSLTTEGSNWYCCKTGLMWDGSLKPRSVKDMEGDIYPSEYIKEEYRKFLLNEESIIVGTQHFDFGFENLSIDITKYVMEVINSIHNDNYGLCLSFTPHYENIEKDIIEYCGFFNDNTNTFFHPYIEVEYDEYIKDDRESFTIGKENKLYLYVSDDGIPTNLDNIPSCAINEVNVPVTQATKGVYYATVAPNAVMLDKNMVAYDKWSQIALNGVKNDDVELDFSTKGKETKVTIGNNSQLKEDYVPSFYGINNDETLSRHEIREISVDFRKKYETDKKYLINSAEYRLYVKDGNREFDVIDYQPIEKSFLNNFFMIYTEDLIPNVYFIDIKINIGRETKYYKEAIRFKIVDNITERYQ